LSRILLATFGSLGDLHPYIAVGRALQVRGHQACIATAPDYQLAVEAAGLEFAPMRPRLDALGARAEVVRRVLHPVRGTEYLLRAIIMPCLADAHADLTRAAAAADLLVSHPLTYTLPLVAQQQSKPWLSSVLAPMSFFSRHDPAKIAGLDMLRLAHRLGPRFYDFVFGIIRRSVRKWEAPLHDYRRQLGLPSTDAIMTFEGQFSPFGTLALFDPLLAPPLPDWPPRTHVCGAPVYDGAPEDPEQLDELRRFLDEGEAPIVFALGSSAVWIAQRYWQHAVTATQQLRRRALLLTADTDLPPLPRGIRSFRYLPYSRIFGSAAAIVHHAGIGTLSQALRCGRPQLMTPVAFDQPDNAARAARLGVGRVLPFPRSKAGRLRAELQQLLTQPCYARAARAVAATLSPVDGASAAADRIIETLGARVQVQ
jgi:rhamnosyltransferase subunit B